MRISIKNYVYSEIRYFLIFLFMYWQIHVQNMGAISIVFVYCLSSFASVHMLVSCATKDDGLVAQPKMTAYLRIVELESVVLIVFVAPETTEPFKFNDAPVKPSSLVAQPTRRLWFATDQHLNACERTAKLPVHDVKRDRICQYMKIKKYEKYDIIIK